MKRENLYLVGGALLASTALSTIAEAGSFTVVQSGTASALGGQATTTARSVSAQIFAATPSTTTQLGPRPLVIRFNQPVSSTFSYTVTVTGAKFKSSATTNAVADIQTLITSTFSGAGSFTLSASANGTAGGSGTAVATTCNMQVGTDTILLTACSLTANTTFNASIGGLWLSGVAFDSATGLATAGTSIALTGTLTIGSVTFETTAAQNVITSVNNVTATGAAATVGQINVSASPAFTSVATSVNSAVIATVNITTATALGGDLSSVLTAADAVGASNSIKLTSAILTDDAASGASFFNGTVGSSTTVTQFGSGFVTFTIAAAGVTGVPYSVLVSFNGTKEIEAAAAGTVDVTFASAAGAGVTANQVAPPAVTGLAASGLSRSGLSIDVNGVQPGVAQGARTYTSLLRIANTGNFAGTVTIVVKNENTGATLGTYTSASIPGGASLQVSSANIESGAGITGTASIGYRLSVSGSINGYVQHVNWNQDAGFFSDLSGSRNGSLTTAVGK